MTAIPSPFVVSWSGGKDSCLALDRVLTAGGTCLGLLNILDASGERSRSHGLRPEVIGAQARALGLPLFTGRAGWDRYEVEFKTLLRSAGEAGARAVVFGDIDLQDHRDWEERVCAEVGLTPVLPLWLEPRDGLVREVLARGWRARIVAVREERLSTDLLGRELDEASLAEIGRQGADLCGEEGEYHSVVVGGPRFDFDVHLVAGEVHREGGVATLDLGLA